MQGRSSAWSKLTTQKRQSPSTARHTDWSPKRSSPYQSTAEFGRTDTEPNRASADVHRWKDTQMKRLVTTMSLVAALMLVLAPAALAGGNGQGGASAEQLERAGWYCFNAGPSNWTHCISPGKKSGSAKATNIKVFTESGSAIQRSAMCDRWWRAVSRPERSG